MGPNPGKVKEVKEWPMPRIKANFESFLGLINFYREHLFSRYRCLSIYINGGQGEI